MQSVHGGSPDRKFTIDELLETRNASAIARKIGVSKVTIIQWRAGRMTPKEKNLQALADALGVSASQIVIEARRAS